MKFTTKKRSGEIKRSTFGENRFKTVCASVFVLVRNSSRNPYHPKNEGENCWGKHDFGIMKRKEGSEMNENSSLIKYTTLDIFS